MNILMLRVHTILLNSFLVLILKIFILGQIKLKKEGIIGIKEWKRRFPSSWWRKIEELEFGGFGAKGSHELVKMVDKEIKGLSSPFGGQRELHHYTSGKVREEDRKHKRCETKEEGGFMMNLASVWWIPLDPWKIWNPRVSAGKNRHQKRFLMLRSASFNKFFQFLSLWFLNFPRLYFFS